MYILSEWMNVIILENSGQVRGCKEISVCMVKYSADGSKESKIIYTVLAACVIGLRKR